MVDTSCTLSHAGLDLQICVLLCQALQEVDPVSFLQNQLHYHNGGHVQLQDVGLGRYITLMTDSNVALAPECKNPPPLEPTIYLAFASETDATFGHFFSPLTPCEFELSPGAEIQMLVSDVLACLPISSLFNMLGQGYKLVLSGHQFGGVIANALASKLLLQLRQEILLAESMGIDLAALATTVDKVISFGFCAPLFGNAHLHEGLSAHKLDANIHTIWKPQDASVHFLTLCGELRMGSIPVMPPSKPSMSGTFEEMDRPSAERSSRGADRSNDGKLSILIPLPEDSTVVRQLRPHLTGAQFKACQSWASILPDEMSKLPLKRHRHNMLTRQIEIRSAPLRDQPVSLLDMPAENCEGNLGKASAPLVILTRTSSNRLNRTSPPAAKPSTPGGAGLVARKDSSTLASFGKMAAIKNALTPNRLRVSTVSPDSPKRAGSTPKGANSPLRRPNAKDSSKDSKDVAPESPSVGSSPAATQTSWKTRMEGLKKLEKEIGTPNLAPLGCFWLLEDAPKAPSSTAKKPATNAGAKVGDSNAGATNLDALVRFKLVEKGTAPALSKGWFAEANNKLLDRWEYTTDELKKDLMEAFAWVSFRPMAEVRGRTVDRKTVIQLAHILDEVQAPKT